MDQLQMLLEENICDGCWRNTFDFEPIRFRDGIREYLATMILRVSADHWHSFLPVPVQRRSCDRTG
jgi:hypothetical protein